MRTSIAPGRVPARRVDETGETVVQDEVDRFALAPNAGSCDVRMRRLAAVDAPGETRLEHSSHANCGLEPFRATGLERGRIP